MKQYTTRFLKSVALGYMAFPIVYIFLVALLFDIPANLCLRILISPLYYFVALWAVVAGYGLWEMKRWSWYPFIISNLLIAYGNAILLGDYSTSHHKGLAFLSSILMLVAIVYRVSREVRVPYFFPKIRWWETNPRYKLSVPVQIVRPNGTSLAGEILDISMGGCFIKIRAEVNQDEILRLGFNVYGFEIDCGGAVVWRTQSTVTHPRGIGIKFGMLDRKQRRTLRMITRRLKKIADLYRRKRYLMTQDEFTQKLMELETPQPSKDSIPKIGPKKASP